MKHRRTQGSGYVTYDARRGRWRATWQADGRSHTRYFREEAEACAHLEASAPVVARVGADRFWARVDTRGVCWPWTGSRSLGGYGRVLWEGKYWQASRLAYVLTHGAIADDLYICHTCDNPICCNPAHLWAGTPSENTRDSVRKGRWGRRRR